MSQLRAFDNLMDRRTLFELLKRLDGPDGEEVGNHRRKCFLAEVAAKLPFGLSPDLLGCRGWPTEVYNFITTLAAQFPKQVKLEEVATVLEKWIRAKGY